MSNNKEKIFQEPHHLPAQLYRFCNYSQNIFGHRMQTDEQHILHGQYCEFVAGEQEKWEFTWLKVPLFECASILGASLVGVCSLLPWNSHIQQHNLVLVCGNNSLSRESSSPTTTTRFLDVAENPSYIQSPEILVLDITEPN